VCLYGGEGAVKGKHGLISVYVSDVVYDCWVRRRFRGSSIKVVFFFRISSRPRALRGSRPYNETRSSRGLGVAAGFPRDNYYREQRNERRARRNDNYNNISGGRRTRRARVRRTDGNPTDTTVGCYWCSRASLSVFFFYDPSVYRFDNAYVLLLLVVVVVVVDPRAHTV